MTLKGKAAMRNAHGYVKKREALRRRTKRLGLPCWLCGYPIDTDLDYRHPMSFTADHVVPVVAGGSMTGELKPAHRSCNSRRGGGRQVKPLPKPVTARQW